MPPPVGAWGQSLLRDSDACDGGGVLLLYFLRLCIVTYGYSGWANVMVCLVGGN